jgi:hypothetical protein
MSVTQAAVVGSATRPPRPGSSTPGTSWDSGLDRPPASARSAPPSAGGCAWFNQFQLHDRPSEACEPRESHVFQVWFDYFASQEGLQCTCK